MTPADLLAARERLGLSQAKLADKLGVDVMTVSRWERGSRALPPHLGLAIEHLSCQRTQPKRQIKPGHW